MKQSLVMTVIGKDRPGLVEKLSAIIEAHGGNWEESRMVHLAGRFAGLLRVHVPEPRAGELERALAGLDELSMTVARTAEPGPLPGSILMVELEGQDHPGIVHRVAKAVAARGINVAERESELGTAPMTGQRMFRARARLRVPVGVSPEDLADDLEQLADDLMVEVTTEE